jgi:CubicO group peptidase (beta-lactamase class C family)
LFTSTGWYIVRILVQTSVTAFRIASLSKTFTAAAIAMLIERGNIRLQDSLSPFFPQFPKGNGITVEQLLSHQSGAGELDSADLTRRCPSSDEMVQLIAHSRSLVPPGTDERYSNEGYVLLAAISERSTAMSYETFLRQKFSSPQE